MCVSCQAPKALEYIPRIPNMDSSHSEWSKHLEDSKAEIEKLRREVEALKIVGQAMLSDLATDYGS